MNKPLGLVLKLAGVAAVALPVLATAPVATAQQHAAAGKILTCSTDTDGYWGHAHCTNNTAVVRAFRAYVKCGWWPDAFGSWKTLKPGQRDVSSARCFGGTGVGSVTWLEG